MFVIGALGNMSVDAVVRKIIEVPVLSRRHAEQLGDVLQAHELGRHAALELVHSLSSGRSVG